MFLESNIFGYQDDTFLIHEKRPPGLEEVEAQSNGEHHHKVFYIVGV
jgi:hypothetical protein